jgi:hypothetical protein
VTQELFHQTTSPRLGLKIFEYGLEIAQIVDNEIVDFRLIVSHIRKGFNPPNQWPSFDKKLRVENLVTLFLA